MNIVIDIEANSLNNPTAVHLIVCKDIDNDTRHIFRDVTIDEKVKNDFISFSRTVSCWIGHNFLGYDYPVLHDLLGLDIPNLSDVSLDTLVISKLVDYSRKQGHSIEAYGEQFGLEKIKFNDWTKWSQEMEDYCVRDVDINHLVYNLYKHILDNPTLVRSIRTEQEFQLVVNNLRNHGFCFNTIAATKLLTKVSKELETLDKEILDAFPPKMVSVREVQPVYTKYGTLHKKDFRWVEGGDLSIFNGGPFTRCAWQKFNPSSHKQIIDVLKGYWTPTEKTKGHVETERILARGKYEPSGDEHESNSRERIRLDLEKHKVYGWKINETNLDTLPPDAPAPARTLAKRILLESRRRTLTEWLGLVQDDGRIHGKFYGIGAWTHRMAHQQPNTANIPTEGKLYGKDMRALWCAPKKRLLCGVDAEGIQLRIFAHYINDPEFTEAIINGRKADKTDPHSINARVLNCTRDKAKRFIFAYLLGAGIGKLAEVLDCKQEAARTALDRLIKRYAGLDHLKREVIPSDAKRGYFEGLDGRRVPIPGDTVGERRHLCMSGYLQNGEAIIMKMACLKWFNKLNGYNSFLVNFVHDEWQTETPNNMAIALEVAKLQADSLREVGKELKLKCPLAGSYYNEDHKDYTIGLNWSVTH